MTACEVIVNGLAYRITDPKIAAHVRYLIEHEALLSRELKRTLVYELVLTGSPAGHGAYVVNKGLPFTRLSGR